MEWTNGQNDAIKFVLRRKSRGTITGAAGTGKTTVINHILSKIPGKTIILAPTHSAARNYKSGKTIHNFFKIVPVDPEAPIIEFSRNISMDGDDLPDTIFIDEGSMVNNDMLSDIMKFVNINKIRLIGIGDKYQLPPVNANGFNDFFSPSEFRQIEMNEIVRQKEGSGIIDYAEQFKQYDYIPRNTNFDNIENLRWESEKFILSFAESYALGKQTRILSYTNKDTEWFNTKCHQMFYDVDFAKGEKIILQQNIYKKKEDSDEFVVYHNGMECTIISSVPEFFVIRDIKNTYHKIDSCVLTILAESGDEISIRVPVSARDKVLIAKLKEPFVKEYLRYKRDKNIGKLEEISLAYGMSQLKALKEISYGYASTIHKSQGRTFDQTYIFVGGAMHYLKQDDIELHNRLNYVASTRCIEKNIILEGKRQ